MDRIDAMRVFVAALDEGSLAGASRKLGRSPAAVSRAIAFLEERVGTQLLYRTTRSVRMSQAGERYAATCRRVLTDLDEADMNAAGERAVPCGTLTLAAPVLAGEAMLRPIVDAFMDLHPALSVRLYLSDRPVKLIEDGVDIALCMYHLPDSTLITIRVGEVRRVVVAAPRYLVQHPRIERPDDLAKHRIITTTHGGVDSWSFPPSPGSSIPRTVQFTAWLAINSDRSALASTIDGRGVTRVLSWQVAEHVRDGELEIVLADDEPPPVPVHVILPNGRLSLPKVRAFVDFAVPRLRSHFSRLAKDAGDTAIPLRRSAEESLPGSPRRSQKLTRVRSH